MATGGMVMPKFNRNDIEQYYKVLGLNPNEEGLIVKDSINLLEIGELYELNEFDKKLPYTSEELSKVYSLLVMTIKNDFLYASSKRRENAFRSALEIIDDLTKFEIDAKDNEELTVDRMNNLKSTIIKGLCCAGDVIDFRLRQKNATVNSLNKKITDIENEEKSKESLNYDIEKTPDELMKLYYIILYSKFKNNGSDFEMFDGIGNITLSRIRSLVRRNIRENVETNDNNCSRTNVESSKILRLSHYQNKY